VFQRIGAEDEGTPEISLPLRKDWPEIQEKNVVFLQSQIRRVLILPGGPTPDRIAPESDTWRDCTVGMSGDIGASTLTVVAKPMIFADDLVAFYIAET